MPLVRFSNKKHMPKVEFVVKGEKEGGWEGGREGETHRERVREGG